MVGPVRGSGASVAGGETTRVLQARVALPRLHATAGRRGPGSDYGGIRLLCLAE